MAKRWSDVFARLAPTANSSALQRCLGQLRYLQAICQAGHEEFIPLLDACVERLSAAFDADGAVTNATVQKIEAMLAPVEKVAKTITVHCVAHAHIDMNWLWRYDETVSLTVSTVRTMLRLMEEYPDFTFSQSQASVYRIIEEYAPELLPQMKKRIREGRWEVVASTWVENDKNLSGGESQARHLLYTRKYLKELLDLTDDQFQIDFEPDTFGHPQGLPELLQSGGIRYYYHCRGQKELPLYRWRGPSGAEVTVYCDPIWYLGVITPESFLHIPGLCLQHGLTQAMSVYGVGDHGGGPSRRDIERIIEMNQWPCMPRLTFSRYLDFFKSLDSVSLPVLEGDLNFIFDGCYTTQTRIKQANAVAEAALVDAETLNAASDLLSTYVNAPERYRQAWENVLFNQFHDILPGSGVIGTREHALGLFQRTMAIAGTRKEAAARGIASLINTQPLFASQAPTTAPGTSEGAGAGFGVAGFSYTNASTSGGQRRAFHLFNPTQFDQDGCVMLTVWDWEVDPMQAICLDENGEALPLQPLLREPVLFWSHAYVQFIARLRVPAYGYRTLCLDRTSKWAAFPEFWQPRVIAPRRFVLENEYLCATFDPSDARLLSLFSKQTGQELVDSARYGGLQYRLEDDQAGMTAWIVGQHQAATPVVGTPRLERLSGGDLRQQFTYDATFGDSTVSVTVSLDAGEPYVRYQATVRFREFGAKGKGVPQLGFVVPLAKPRETFACGTPFGVVDRAPAQHDLPAHGFVAACENEGSVMLLSHEKYGFRCSPDEMGLTLIRAAFDPDPAPECYDHQMTWGIGVCQGADAHSLLCVSSGFRQPVVPVDAVSHEGSLPMRGSFLAVEGCAARITAIKASEDGSGDLVLRLQEVSGLGGDVTLSFVAPPKAAWYADIHETKQQGLVPLLSANKLTAHLSPYSIVTVRVTFSAEKP